MSAGSYREAAPLELELAWRDHGEADRGLRELLARLTERGVELRPTVALELRPYAQALAEAEGEVATLVAWELAKQLNERLAKAGAEERLYRSAPEATTWVLTSAAGAERLRSEGRPLLDRAPGAQVPARALAFFLSAFGALGVVAYALWSSGAVAVLVGWLALGLAGNFAIRRLTREGSRAAAMCALIHEAAMVVIPPAELARRGELLLAGLVVVATLIAWVVQRWGAVDGDRVGRA